jgi:hypothetical protein
MKITRKSAVSGTERTLDLDVSVDQMSMYLAGALIQDAFPHLPKDQREFIKSGITQDEWDAIFKEEDE